MLMKEEREGHSDLRNLGRLGLGGSSEVGVEKWVRFHQKDMIEREMALAESRIRHGKLI